MTHDRHHRLIAALILLSGGAVALPAAAQDADDTPPPADQTDGQPDARLDPALTDRSLDELMSQRTTRPDVAAPVEPSTAPASRQVVPNQAADPGALELESGATVWTGAATLLPEGTFLARRVGEVVRLRGGGLAFLPAAAEDERTPPAVLLLPCETYGRLESLLRADDRGLWVTLTGEVFAYHDRNFVLPASFATMPNPVEQTDAGVEPADEQAADSDSPDVDPETDTQDQPEQPEGDPRIDDLVRDLEAQRTERRGIDTRFEESQGAGFGEQGAVPYIEGRMLLSQRGRMVRTRLGGWAVSIDNDADSLGDAIPDLLRLLPSAMVQRMERQAERLGDSWAFEISGNLYRHGDGVYLVPRMYVSLPSDEVRAMQ